MAQTHNFTPQAAGFGGYPPELQGEAQRIARRQALADAMVARGMEPYNPGTQVVSGIAIRNSPLAGLAHMLTPWVAERQQQKVAEERAQLAQKYNAGLAAAVQDYIQRRSGTPEEVLGQDHAGADIHGPTRPAMPATPQQRMEAVTRAMTSGYGPLATIAGKDYEAVLKEQLTPKDQATLFEKYTPQSIAAWQASGGRQPLVPRTKYEVVDGLAHDPYNPRGERIPLQTYTTDRVPGPDGKPIIVQKASETGKMTRLSAAPGTTVNVDMGAKKGAEEQAKFMATNLGESRKIAQDASDGIAIAARASEIFNEAARMGSFAEARNFIDKALVTMGLKDDKGNLIGNTSNLRRVMSDLALANTQKLRPVSNDELQFLLKMNSPADATPQEFKQLLEMVTDSSIAIINRHNARAARTPEHTEGYREALMVSSPVSQFSIRNPTAGPAQSGEKELPGLPMSQRPKQGQKGPADFGGIVR